MSTKNILDYMDTNSLIGQKQNLFAEPYIEGGDSMQRTGFMAIAAYFCKIPLSDISLINRMKHHEVYPGVFVRNPLGGHYHDDRSKNFYTLWYNQPKTTSRDQCSPCIVACGLFNLHDYLGRFLVAHIKRLFFYQNTMKNGESNRGTWKIPDIASPEHMGFYIRGFRAWYLYPLLYISDLFSIGASIQKLYYSKTPHNVDDLNRIVSLVQSNYVYPTTLSRISLWIYKKRKSFKEGVAGPRYALTRYFSAPEDPPMDVFYDKVLKRFFE